MEELDSMFQLFHLCGEISLTFKRINVYNYAACKNVLSVQQ